MILIAIVIIIIVALILKSYSDYSDKKARREGIYQKYGHTELSEKIINKTVWVGETSDQLLDSLGKPIDIDENVLKTKRKEVWKYCRKSTNRYGFKVKVENDIVIGWDEKM